MSENFRQLNPWQCNVYRLLWSAAMYPSVHISSRLGELQAERPDEFKATVVVWERATGKAATW